MKLVTAPIIRKYFATNIGKTAIEVNFNGKTVTAFANGDQSENGSLLANLRINEVGDTFVATNDSKQLDKDNKPLFLKGQTVTRQKESVDFLSFSGDNTATQFAQGAKAFGLQLNVIMQG